MVALAINPSYSWAGNDGNWSTFQLRIGTPPQSVDVLPSTSGSSIWVGAPDACDSVYTACPTLRGGLFSSGLSTSYGGIDGTQAFDLDFRAEEPLEYYGTANVGVDTVAIGNTGNLVSIEEKQFMAVYDSNLPWVGLLGLQVQNVTVLDIGYESPLGRLNTTNAIPSAYYAYTAGAYWENTYASLTLGGYDLARGDVGNALRFNLSADVRNTVVSVVGISITTTSGAVPPNSPVQLPINAFIDSMVAEIWLPIEICQVFETAFNLTWNETVAMYLVDDALHEALVANKQNVTFTLASGSNTGESTDIILPYSAFDLVATFPLAGIRTVSGQQRYFPLQRANTSDQVYLGRTFLQAAYLAVDFDRREFAVTQSLYPNPGDNIEIKTVTRPSTDIDEKGLKAGAIAGIVIGAVALLAIIAALIFFFFWRKKKNTEKGSKSTSKYSSSIGGTTIEGWAENVTSQEHFPFKTVDGEEEGDRFKSELDARDTVRAPVGFVHRHELSAGTIRRTSNQSGFSRGSGVSPMAEQRNGQWSDSFYGAASPGPPGSPDFPEELSGVQSPVQTSSPPLAPAPLFLREGTFPAFELHAESSPMRTPLPTANADPMELNRPLSGDRADEPFLPPARDVSPVRQGGARTSRFEEQTETSAVSSAKEGMRV